MSWRHPADGGFDPARYRVDVIDEAAAKAFVVEHHYSGTYPAARIRVGLFDTLEPTDVLVGVAVFAVPVQAKVLSNVFPDLEVYRESLELARFVLLDACPSNSETWFLARAFTELLAAGVRGVVSFADPVPRRSMSGDLILPGHVGTIYQAKGAVYCGRGTARTLTVLPDGTTFNDRARQKFLAGEQGERYVAERLESFGARPRKAGDDRRVWLIDALEGIGASRLRHRGCHRYAFPLGSNQRARDRITVTGQLAVPFPKMTDLPEQA